MANVSLTVDGQIASMHLITKDKDDLIKKLRLEIERVTEDSENLSKTVAGVSERPRLPWLAFKLWPYFFFLLADPLSHPVAVHRTRWNMHVLQLN